MSTSKVLGKLKYHWLCFQEWLLFHRIKAEYLILLHLVTGYMKKYRCSLDEAAKQLPIGEENRALCESILRICTFQTTTLGTAVDTYLRKQYDKEVYE